MDFRAAQVEQLSCARVRVHATIVTFTLALATSLLCAGAAWASRPKAHPVTIEWVGDIALSSERGLPPGGLTGALAPVRGLLHGAELTVGNLEGTLSVGGASKC